MKLIARTMTLLLVAYVGSQAAMMLANSKSDIGVLAAALVAMLTCYAAYRLISAWMK